MKLSTVSALCETAGAVAFLAASAVLFGPWVATLFAGLVLVIVGFVLGEGD